MTSACPTCELQCHRDHAIVVSWAPAEWPVYRCPECFTIWADVPVVCEKPGYSCTITDVADPGCTD